MHRSSGLITMSEFNGMRNRRIVPWKRFVFVFLVCVLSDCHLVNAQNKTSDSARPVPSPSLAFNTDTVGPRRFIAVHGQRSLIGGYSENGLEVWAYPLQLVTGYHLGFRSQGATTEISDQAILRHIAYFPQAIIRTYIGQNFIVREKIFVPLHVPGAIISYNVESVKPVDIVVHFTPVLNLMWPAAIGGQDTSWSSTSSGYIVSEPTHRFSAVIGSTAIIAHDEIANSTNSANQGQLAFTIRAGGASHNETATVAIASLDHPSENPTEIVQQFTQSQRELERNAIAHYASLRAKELQIQTPDETINRDLAWAEMALDQAWVCNPYLGCGLVAGYGPSRGARRPQYAWFFAGDAMIAVRSLVSAGEYSRARDALEFIAKYQDKKTGMVWHEISQSAGLIDWAGKYPYMFVHVDITFQYLSSVANYVAVSGDKSFLQDHWSSVESAYRYCESLLDPGDGLPHIPSTKEGGSEQDRMSDELMLSASWVKASNAYAQMERWRGDTGAAEKAEEENKKARSSIAQLYWNPEAKFWFDGHSPSGKAIFQRSVNGSETISQHIFNDKQERELLDQLASPNFQTDWGTRSVSLNSSSFDPNSYAKGSVWALGTTDVATAFWAGHRPSTALSLWNRLIPWSSLDSMGHMDEVLAGDHYHEQTESVPEQTWSSAAFLYAAVHGLFGLKVNALKNEIEFAPHLPSNWNSISLRNINLPRAKIVLTLLRKQNGFNLNMSNTGMPTHLIFSPELPLGAQLTESRMDEKRISTHLQNYPQETQARTEVEIPSGKSKLFLGYEGGVSLTVSQENPLLGDSSHGIRLIREQLIGSTYTLDAEVESGWSNKILLTTTRKIVRVQGATWHPVSKDSYALKIDSSRTSNPLSGYVKRRVLVELGEP